MNFDNMHMLLSQIAFPSALCLIFFFYIKELTTHIITTLDKRQEKTNNVISENTRVLKKLCERVFYPGIYDKDKNSFLDM